MPKIVSKIDINSEEYQTNYKHNKLLAQELEKLEENIKKMGPEKYVNKHINRGKITARDRISLLKMTLIQPFFEFSCIAGHELYEDYIPAAGIITGLIYIHQKLCIVIANDATVKGGTYYPITVKEAPQSSRNCFGK